MTRGGSKGSGDPFIHPVLLLLLVLIAVVAVGRYYAPERDRHRALAAASTRPLFAPQPPSVPRPPAEPDGDGDDTPVPLELEEIPSHFEDWYRDDDLDAARCAFDASYEGVDRLEIHHGALPNGMDLLMSPQDLAFLAWTSFTYRLNPHFLMGIMMAESAGDCSAVSVAGAQGCFQITYRQGAGQLRNSFPERVSLWYWAPRTTAPEYKRRPGEALGYWPADLYVPPEKHYGFKVSKRSRQLRMTWDPAATMLESRAGDTAVSSVANFSFGVVGAGLYFHFLNYYLYSHENRLKGDVREMVNMVGLKAKWMAASYNQGAGRSMKTLGYNGPKRFLSRTAPDVLNYAETVSDFCEEFQLGRQTYGGTMTWGQFLDFLQQLRWTYSEVPIDWESLHTELKARFFRDRTTIDLRTDLLPIFRAMRTLEPRLGPEKPIVDHQVRF